MAVISPVSVSNIVQSNAPSALDIFSFDIVQDTSGHVIIRIIIPSQIIDVLFESAAHTQQKQIKAPGFDFGQAPIEFLKNNYQNSLIEHLKEFLFKYCVINIVYRIIRHNALVIAGEPRIASIHLMPGCDAIFNLECTTIDDITINEWRYLPFKAPKRKNYKDLDRQVEHFIAEETELCNAKKHLGIQENDWVALSIERTQSDGTPLIAGFAQLFWLQISDEQVDNPLRDLLQDQKVGFIGITQNKGLQDYFSEQLATDYWYKIIVLDHLPYAYFCLEQFRQHFKIKTKKELLKKCIEVFSYRNDISQRRATVEECLKLLIGKHYFEVPSFVKTRFQEKILLSIHNSPDYNVYRTQKEFTSLIQDLAEKAAKESIFVDALAYHEQIQVTPEDVSYYLNFTKRGRTKEFIYFEPPIHMVEGQATLIAQEELIRYCLREKALNYVIYHLTKE
ncbi:MAG TPA: trigger factor [Candidatus Babeliales bacterium]|jgi:FKBP-type peptidyl-prolyl cis-trans isomerase (trigger factor)|nr:trigger factor [Candidatus Babeliales bacterium]